jgi:hypothetical protein
MSWRRSDSTSMKAPVESPVEGCDGVEEEAVDVDVDFEDEVAVVVEEEEVEEEMALPAVL